MVGPFRGKRIRHTRDRKTRAIEGACTDNTMAERQSICDDERGYARQMLTEYAAHDSERGLGSVDNLFWITAHHTAAKLRRGELFEALARLNLIRTRSLARLI